MIHLSMNPGAAGGRGRSHADTPEASVPEVLLDQHRRLRGLLGDVRDDQGDERRRSFALLRAVLAAHETAEETVVRPVSKQIMDRDAVADLNHEERYIVRLLAVLEKFDPCDAAFEELFPTFAEALESHFELEETSEFPILRAELAERDRVLMGRWIGRAMAHGPTHAHPGGFGSPMVERAVTPFTSLLDHARDAYGRARGHQ